ncbi:MAG: RNA methyltransferase [Myxococcota bacterium]|nr:RNA methyltransferase [Myxococcota bacterium]
MSAPIYITTPDSPYLEPYRDLKRKGRSNSSLAVIAEGEIVLQRAFSSDWSLQSVLATPAKFERLRASIPADTQVYLADQRLLQNLLGFKFHRGCLACVNPKPPLNIEDFISNKLPKFVLGLSQVTDPRNIGSIFRIGAAFGADLILLDPECSDPLSRMVARVSMGTLFHIPFSIAPFEDSLEKFRKNGPNRQMVVATTPNPSGIAIHDIKWCDTNILIFGNEGQGLRPNIIAQCDIESFIPISSDFDSINVANAASICAYEVRKHLSLTSN